MNAALKTIATLTYLTVFAANAQAQHARNLPSQTCRTISGAYWTPNAGSWSESFFYSSIFVDPRTRTTAYNRFIQEYQFLRFALDLNITGHWGAYWRNIEAAFGTLGTRLAGCLPSVNQLTCFRGAWAEYWEAIDNYEDLRSQEIEQSKAYADDILRSLMAQRGGCDDA